MATTLQTRDIDMAADDWSLAPLVIFIVLYSLYHGVLTYFISKPLENQTTPIVVWSVLLYLLAIFIMFNIRYRQMAPKGERTGAGLEAEEDIDPVTEEGRTAYKASSGVALGQGLIYLGIISVYFFAVALIILRKTNRLKGGLAGGGKLLTFLETFRLQGEQTGSLLTIMIIITLVGSINSLILYFKNLSVNDNYPYLKSFMGSQIFVFFGTIFTLILFGIMGARGGWSDTFGRQTGDKPGPFEGKYMTIMRIFIIITTLVLGFFYIQGVWMNRDKVEEDRAKDGRADVTDSFASAFANAFKNLPKYGLFGLGFGDNKWEPSPAGG